MNINSLINHLNINNINNHHKYGKYRKINKLNKDILLKVLNNILLMYKKYQKDTNNQYGQILNIKIKRIPGL